MKRHQSLVPLSRDHHHGLLCSWKLRQGMKKEVPASRMQVYVQYFFEQHLKEHFREEEELVFHQLQDNLVLQAIEEHRSLEKMVAEIGEATYEQFISFATALDSHIRFEERSLFPHLEKALSDEQLEVIGKRLEAIHEEPVLEEFEDEFWL